MGYEEITLGAVLGIILSFLGQVILNSINHKQRKKEIKYETYYKQQLSDFKSLSEELEQRIKKEHQIIKNIILSKEEAEENKLKKEFIKFYSSEKGLRFSNLDLLLLPAEQLQELIDTEHKVYELLNKNKIDKKKLNKLREDIVSSRSRIIQEIRRELSF